jgi:16S rRNA processing protein RimM
MTLRKTARKANSGSPPTGEPEYLLVGMLRRPHGLNGELVMQVVTDFPERLKPGTEVAVGPAHRVRVIASSRRHAEGMLIGFERIDSPELAGQLRNEPVYVSAANRPALPAGQHYHHELLGLEVIGEDGASIGHLKEILLTGANDVLVVQTDDHGELLLPAIDSVMGHIDLEGRTLLVRVPDGLIPERPISKLKHAHPGRKRNARR